MTTKRKRSLYTYTVDGTRYTVIISTRSNGTIAHSITARRSPRWLFGMFGIYCRARRTV